MQPLKTSTRPSSSSIIGCAPATDTSMIFSRWCSSASRPSVQVPSLSGPRGRRQGDIRPTAASSAGRPSRRSSPAKPHIVASLVGFVVSALAGRLGAEQPGVLGTAAALTRVAPPGSMVVNTSRGGGSKDTWLLGPQSSSERTDDKADKGGDYVRLGR